MSGTPTYTGNIEIFFAYSRENKKQQKKLENHLSSLKRDGVSIYFVADQDNDKNHALLNRSHIIGLLISAEFIDSSWGRTVEQVAMQRKKKEELRVIPIKLRSVDLQGTLYAGLHSLPKNQEPVDSKFWKTQNEAYYDIAKGIREAVEEIRSEIVKRQERPEFKLYRLLSLLVLGLGLFSMNLLFNPIRQASKIYLAVPNYNRILAPKTVSDGWMFIGRVSQKSKLVSSGERIISGSQFIDSPVVPKINSKVTVIYPIKLRKNMPQAPNFNPQEQDELGTLKSGDKIEIIKIKYFVDPNDTPLAIKVWAEVRRQ